MDLVAMLACGVNYETIRTEEQARYRREREREKATEVVELRMLYTTTIREDKNALLYYY